MDPGAAGCSPRPAGCCGPAGARRPTAGPSILGETSSVSGAGQREAVIGVRAGPRHRRPRHRVRACSCGSGSGGSSSFFMRRADHARTPAVMATSSSTKRACRPRLASARSSHGWLPQRQLFRLGVQVGAERHVHSTFTESPRSLLKPTASCTRVVSFSSSSAEAAAAPAVLPLASVTLPVVHHHRHVDAPLDGLPTGIAGHLRTVLVRLRS